MLKLFSDSELRHLRNDLAIERLMTALNVPLRRCKAGQVQFECPKCFGYHTGIHLRTNLARCFTCRQNFNAIEIAMQVLQLPFVQAVLFLQQQETNLRKIKETSPQLQGPSTSRFMSIRDVLKQMVLSAR